MESTVSKTEHETHSLKETLKHRLSEQKRKVIWAGLHPIKLS